MAQLTAEQEAYHTLAAQMRDLIGHFSWDAYCMQLERIEQDHIARMLAGDKAQFEYLKGRIEGLREAVHFPAHIIAQAKGLLNG